MSKVSVIIPLYNREEFIAPCLQSVINQTYRDMEIVVIDDGSTDRSPEICMEWSRTDSRIKLWQQKNSGVSAARNRGLELAEGEYVSYTIREVTEGCKATVWIRGRAETGSQIQVSVRKPEDGTAEGTSFAENTSIEEVLFSEETCERQLANLPAGEAWEVRIFVTKGCVQIEKIAFS